MDIYASPVRGWPARARLILGSDAITSASVILLGGRGGLRWGRWCWVGPGLAGSPFFVRLVLRAEAGLDQIAQAAGRRNRKGRRNAAESEVLIFRAAEYPVIRSLMPNARAGAEMLRLHAADPLGPDAARKSCGDSINAAPRKQAAGGRSTPVASRNRGPCLSD
jgi:hypothetical protein